MLESGLADVDAACSRFRPDSELVRAATGTEVTVSPLLAEAIAVALRAAELTDGDVDPTVGGAMAALGYDRDFAELIDAGSAYKPGRHAAPGHANAGHANAGHANAGHANAGGAEMVARAVPGWRQVRFDADTRTLELPPGVRLDLGATAKAWAADRSATQIAATLGCGVLVSLGGDTAVAGPPPPGGWQIRVQDITGPIGQQPDGPAQVVAITEGGLATSSTAARRWRHGDETLHHILNPRTGRPAEPVWRTVSVTAATCADANIASTAAVIRGVRAPGWLADLRMPARLVSADGKVATVAGWPRDGGHA
jgi:thiamine biosynthesis lipoprotein ApbE